jgi:hypothetical protein
LLIWDVLFLEGSVTLFKTALTILKMLKKEIMSKSGFGILVLTLEEIYSLLDFSIKNITDTNVLLYSILLKKYDIELDNNFLLKTRSSMEFDVIDRLKKSRLSTQMILNQKYRLGKHSRVSFVQDHIACNKEWQICIYDIEYKFNFSSFLVFRIIDTEKVEYLEDYFFEKSHTNSRSKSKKNLFPFSSSTFIEYNNLLIERRLHKCELDDSLIEKQLLEDKSFLSKSIDLRNESIFENKEEDNENDKLMLEKKVLLLTDTLNENKDRLEENSISKLILT